MGALRMPWEGEPEVVAHRAPQGTHQGRRKGLVIFLLPSHSHNGYEWRKYPVVPCAQSTPLVGLEENKLADFQGNVVGDCGENGVPRHFSAFGNSVGRGKGRGPSFRMPSSLGLSGYIMTTELLDTIIDQGQPNFEPCQHRFWGLQPQWVSRFSAKISDTRQFVLFLLIFVSHALNFSSRSVPL